MRMVSLLEPKLIERAGPGCSTFKIARGGRCLLRLKLCVTGFIMMTDGGRELRKGMKEGKRMKGEVRAERRTENRLLQKC